MSCSLCKWKFNASDFSDSDDFVEQIIKDKSFRLRRPAV